MDALPYGFGAEGRPPDGLSARETRGPGARRTGASLANSVSTSGQAVDPVGPPNVESYWIQALGPAEEG
jgi:hypothetical protein